MYDKLHKFPKNGQICIRPAFIFYGQGGSVIVVMAENRNKLIILIICRPPTSTNHISGLASNILLIGPPLV